MNEFVISCNLNQFDLVQFFEKNNKIVWKQTKKCNIGDIVYIYVGRPYSRLFFKCSVVAANISTCPPGNPFYENNTGRQKNPLFMELQLDKVLPECGLSLQQLLDNGLKTVQCSTQVSDELHRYILRIISKRC